MQRNYEVKYKKNPHPYHRNTYKKRKRNDIPYESSKRPMITKAFMQRKNQQKETKEDKNKEENMQ